jgi:GT2 family glycosyltransferase
MLSKYYSVIIVTKGKEEYLLRCIKSIVKQIIWPNEIIIIDNGSYGGLFEEITEMTKFIDLHIFYPQSDLGVCDQINFGIRKAKESNILVMDNDAELATLQWTKNALEILKRNDVALVWGKTINTNSLEDTRLRPKSCRMKDMQRKTRIFSGNAFMVKKYDWLKIGGYNARFFIYRNEQEAGLRLILRGKKLIQNDLLISFHHEDYITQTEKMDKRGTLIKYKSKKYTYYSYSNTIFFYYIHFPLRILISQSLFFTLEIGYLSIKNRNVRIFLRAIFRIVKLIGKFQRRVISKYDLRQFKKKTRKILKY